jgi:hypothetical protein
LSFFVLCFSHVLRNGFFSIINYYYLLYQTLFHDPLEIVTFEHYRLCMDVYSELFFLFKCFFFSFSSINIGLIKN